MTYTRNPDLAKYIDEVLEKNPIEAEMVRKLIEAMRDDNPISKIYDGEEWVKIESGDPLEILDIVFNLDEVRLYGANGAMVFLVFGNDPDELFCDYSVSLEEILDPITEWATEQMEA